MSLKRILLVFGLLVVGIQGARSQGNLPRREIYVALAYGDAIFEPETWRASAREESAKTIALWESDEHGAIGYLEYLHFEGGLSEEIIKDTFNDNWFEISFENYASWEEVAECQFDGTTLFEFDMLNNDIQYRMRYWIRAETETRAITFFLVFPTAQMEALDEYSARFDPVGTACEPG
jgi:hypothetical protein